ncbi:unnamed protein product [Oikopleura dioica]|uniref:Uncharacterized protein n=1 Tax=Oikopleura dioica TaxID=34765 RepID=E4XK12_OIKDI|nr:unnamed protein product [Oikopleura dioica]CBY31971.1 unnamed protein product [Oikopleura dioica]
MAEINQDEYSEWTLCDAFCDPGFQRRYKLSEEGVQLENSLETRSCPADDLKCGLSLGLPAVAFFLMIGLIYWFCRRHSDESTELRRGHARLVNYQSALNHA